MIKHVDLMIRNVGYINSLSKDIYVKFLVAVPGTVETAWPPEYFFGVGNSEGQDGLDKLALKKVCLVFFDHRFFGRWLQLRGLYSSLWNISSRQKNQLVV